MRHVTDLTLPGITRHRAGGTFLYRGPDGQRVRDPAELERIRKLAVPPAYTDVWICPLADGHLQATGRDARGRKQYRYHPDWCARRSGEKFERLEAFGRALPRIRRRVLRDLSASGSGLSRALILATLVRLLDTTFARIGNESYTRANGSFGLTTLRNRHADIHGQRVDLSFRGKHGITQTVYLDDRRVAAVIRRCRQLPGQDLFQYEEDGKPHGIGSGDVNDYLAEAAGERFTAKDFRTWHGSVQALELTRLAWTRGTDPPSTASARQIISAVAAQLGNTEAVCKKSYIHPDILLLTQGVSTRDAALPAPWAAPAACSEGLRAAEKRLLQFLARGERRRRRLAAEEVRKEHERWDRPGRKARVPNGRLARLAGSTPPR